MLSVCNQNSLRPERFTYPFCYVPHPLIEAAAEGLIAMIDGDSGLRSIFSEGKMLGVLMVKCSEPTEAKDGISYLYAFSGIVGGRSLVEGFVPPIFDLTRKEGHFKQEEAEISALNGRIKQLESVSEPDRKLISALKTERKDRSIALQKWIFQQYIVSNAKGEKRSILDIFADRGIVPPGGTGDCAAPKLLNYAYSHGMEPLAMGEFWYGASPEKELRKQGSFYPSCMGKCGPLLAYMMQGLEVDANPLDSNDEGIGDYSIIYEDENIIVVNKPSGMLAVPGKTMKVSLLERLRSDKGNSDIHSCHRLDMDTSGVMVYAKGVENQVCIEQQFEHRETAKSYIARLSAVPGAELPAPSGRIILPLMLDYYDRPRQMVDFENGKQAVTDYELIGVNEDGSIDILFTPLTGRTHQLRVHSAHPKGLGRPIVGDRLYGDSSDSRLHLHAAYLRFRHPQTGEMLEFSSEPDFLFGNKEK